MTFLPKSEIVGVLDPSSINTKDIGVNWSIATVDAVIDLIKTISYLGNGISIFGSILGNVWRSTDYGEHWTDLGAISAFGINASCYIGNGKVIVGDANGHEWVSKDFGVTWADIGDISGGNRPISSFSYIGNGIVIVTIEGSVLPIGTGRIKRSTDQGITWATVRADDMLLYLSSAYLENGIAIAGRSDGHIFRSIDFGANWTDLGDTTGVAASIFNISYLGNGIVIFGTNDNHIFRSSDFGVSWADQGDITGSIIQSSSYLGNGIVIVSTYNGHIWRSTNFGLSWTDLGVIGLAGRFYATAYLSDGIVLAGGLYIAGGAKKLNRSDVSYKLGEAEVLIDSSIITTTSVNTFIGQSHNMVNADATAGGITVRLPNANIVQRGHEFVIKKIDSSINTVVAQPAGGAFIDGKASKTLTTQYQSITIRSDGSNWYTVNEFVNPSIISPPGHLKPAITRYILPGWTIVRVDTNVTLIDNTIYYIPFFVTDVTTYTEIVLFLFQNGSAGNLADLDIFEWNNGVPGALLYSIGTIATDATIGTLYKPKAINVTLNRGFYFMGITNNNIGVSPIFRSLNNAFPFVSPVVGMANSAASSTTNFTNAIVMTAPGPLADPAPAPTGMSFIPIFTLKEN